MDEFEKMASGRLYNPAAPKLDATHGFVPTAESDFDFGSANG